MLPKLSFFFFQYIFVFMFLKWDRHIRDNDHRCLRVERMGVPSNQRRSCKTGGHAAHSRDRSNRCCCTLHLAVWYVETTVWIWVRLSLLTLPCPSVERLTSYDHVTKRFIILDKYKSSELSANNIAPNVDKCNRQIRS